MHQINPTVVTKSLPLFLVCNARKHFAAFNKTGNENVT